jgi:hypothetical protein
MRGARSGRAEQSGEQAAVFALVVDRQRRAEGQAVQPQAGCGRVAGFCSQGRQLIPQGLVRPPELNAERRYPLVFVRTHGASVPRLLTPPL